MVMHVVVLNVYPFIVESTTTLIAVCAKLVDAVLDDRLCHFSLSRRLGNQGLAQASTFRVGDCPAQLPSKFQCGPFLV